MICLIDASGFSIEKQINTIDNVLETMEIQHKPRINVFNKIDLIDETEISFLEKNYPGSIFISAKTGAGLYELKCAIKEILREYVHFRK
ncbi:MAG: hypothetical protein ACP5QD_04215 [Candidatus Ratteibacteria bacterium]